MEKTENVPAELFVHYTGCMHPSAQPVDVSLLQEYALELRIDTLRDKLVCTPEHLDELALGHLITEGLIRTKNEVGSMDVIPAEHRVSIALRDGYGQEPCPFLPAVPIPWETEWIFQLEQALSSTALYRQTNSAHSAMLMKAGEILCCREDIGRHNAIDKVVGWSELEGIDRSGCLLFTSGRMPSDMVAKAIRAGTPVFVSKALPTAQSIALAKQYQLTLVHVSKRLGVVRFT